MSEPHRDLEPQRVFETLTAYQPAAALSAAIRLELFTRIGEGTTTAAMLADACQASDRGIRILCDYLVAHRWLGKSGDAYSLGEEAAAFLDRRSPRYLGDATTFLNSGYLESCFADLVGAVRKGGTVRDPRGTTAAEHPVWRDFARAMAPVATTTAAQVAAVLAADGGVRGRVLDVAAGHGMYGITILERWPETTVAALDWPEVVAIAGDNAVSRGFGDRHRCLAGDAMSRDLEGPYDLVLLTNFLHHYDRAACTTLLGRIRGAMAAGGRVLTVEQVPDESRTSPPRPAGFALVMLATTPAGDAYTFAEYQAMFRAAGFGPSELHEIPPNRCLLTAAD